MRESVFERCSAPNMQSVFSNVFPSTEPYSSFHCIHGERSVSLEPVQQENVGRIWTFQPRNEQNTQVSNAVFKAGADVSLQRRGAPVKMLPNCCRVFKNTSANPLTWHSGASAVGCVLWSPRIHRCIRRACFIYSNTTLFMYHLETGWGEKTVESADVA